MQNFIDEGYVKYIHDDFSQHVQSNKIEAKYSILSSHRVLHLLSTPELVQEFKKAISYAAKDEALIVLSARDKRDYNNKQMKWVNKDTGIAQYKNRPDHIIHFWSEERFRKEFEDISNEFNIISIVQGHEIESIENKGVHSYYTTMVAHRKPRLDVI